MRLLPPNISSKIDPKDKNALGILSDEDRKKRYSKKIEKLLRNAILSYCSRHNYKVGIAQSHRKSGYTVGWPDLSIIMPGGVTLYVELKTLTGLSLDQEVIIGIMRVNNHKVYIVQEYDEFLNIIQQYE